MLKQNLPLPATSRRLTLALLVAAILLQDLVWLIAVRLVGPGWPEWPAVVAMALVFSQVTLGAVLAVWTIGAALARGLLMVLNLAVAGYVAARSTNDDVGSWIGILMFASLVVAAPLVIFRLAGVRLVETANPQPSPAASRQFTIYGLFSLTTVVAVALGVARHMHFPWDEIGQIGVFVLALGAIPWICSTLALIRWRMAVALAVSALVCPLVGWGISKTGFPPEHPRELIAMSCLQGALTLGMCAVVRAAGFHLDWPGPQAGQSPQPCVRQANH